MRIEFYGSVESFGAAALEILLENEVQNNLPINFILGSGGVDTSKWILCTVNDDAGGVLLTAACTPPFSIVLYETRNKRNDDAVKFLVQEFKAHGYVFPGVMAERTLALSFAEKYAGENRFRVHTTMNIMRLDSVSKIERAHGAMRELREEDLYFAPYWSRAFAEECDIETYTVVEYIDSIRKTLGQGKRYLWEDGTPAAMAANTRATPNGAIVDSVYTPPHLRGKGYATSLVAELSELLLSRGNKFCALFADAANPISNGIYRKIGYRDVCVVDQQEFDA